MYSILCPKYDGLVQQPQCNRKELAAAEFSTHWQQEKHSAVAIGRYATDTQSSQQQQLRRLSEKNWAEAIVIVVAVVL